MPGFDRTGPLGGGPRTGGGMGYCGASQRRDSRSYYGAAMGAGVRGGRGARRGGGLGFCRRWWPGGGRSFWGRYPAAADDREFLAAQIDELRAELAGMEKQLAGMRDAGESGDV